MKPVSVSAEVVEVSVEEALETTDELEKDVVDGSIDELAWLVGGSVLLG